MYRIVLCLFLSSLTMFGQEEVAKKGEGWKAWLHLSETILSNKEKESIALCSGRMKEGFSRFGMANIVEEVRQMKPKFIRELINKDKDSLYLIADIQVRITALIFKKKNDIWLFDDQTPGDFKSAAEAESWGELNMLSSSLREVAYIVSNFAANNPGEPLPEPKRVGLGKEQLTFENPETEKSELFLVVRGVKFETSPAYLLAVTPKPIFGKYYAVFEDGSIKNIEEKFFSSHQGLFGIYKEQRGSYSEKELDLLNSLLTQLGDGSFKVRKKAKKEFIKLGQFVVPFLNSHAGHKDLEVKLTVKELMKTIKETSVPVRPSL
ncbi:MAG: hypothetical protein NE334_20450 [Lentisphaeraceae bacterium]|nr:hypothetical protein [Lentisphaeraceae bacterium]